MQVTLTIPDDLAAELIAAGKDPARAALEALTDHQRLLDLASEADEQEGLRQALDDITGWPTLVRETWVPRPSLLRRDAATEPQYRVPHISLLGC